MAVVNASGQVLFFFNSILLQVWGVCINLPRGVWWIPCTKLFGATKHSTTFLGGTVPSEIQREIPEYINNCNLHLYHFVCKKKSISYFRDSLSDSETVLWKCVVSHHSRVKS